MSVNQYTKGELKRIAGRHPVNDTLDSLEEINANTQENKLAGALAVKEIANNLTAGSLPFRFATDGEGNYGYLGADDSFIPFKKGNSLGSANLVKTLYAVNGSVSYTVQEDGDYLISAAAVNWESSSGSYTSAASISATGAVLLASNKQVGDTASANGGACMSVAYVPSCKANSKITTYFSWCGIALIFKL